MSEIEALRARVAELEKALEDAVAESRKAMAALQERMRWHEGRLDVIAGKTEANTLLFGAQVQDTLRSVLERHAEESAEAASGPPQLHVVGN